MKIFLELIKNHWKTHFNKTDSDEFESFITKPLFFWNWDIHLEDLYKRIIEFKSIHESCDTYCDLSVISADETDSNSESDCESVNGSDKFVTYYYYKKCFFSDNNETNFIKMYELWKTKKPDNK